MASEVSPAPPSGSLHTAPGPIRRVWRRAVRSRFTPLILLALLSAVSLGARLVWLDSPYTHHLIFDEAYYIDAARVILGKPVQPGSVYYNAPAGLDPNTEHPPLAKLAIAGSMKLFGDNPVGWRAPSLLFGSVAIVAMYWLVRSAGGSPWLALGAASLMVADNLALVHGGIGTLDIFVLVFMLVAMALYLRERWVLAGVALGVGACTKVVAFYAFVAIVLLEILRVKLPSGGREGRRVAADRLPAVITCAAATAVSFLAVLWVLDLAVTSYHDPISHAAFMMGYHTRPIDTGPTYGVAPESSPWEWLVNRKAITYYEVGAKQPKQAGFHPVAFFQGRISPFIIWLAVPAFALAVGSARRERDDVSFLAVAWCVGIYLPFVVLGLRHVSYLYYMLTVLPGIYLAVARLFSGRYLPRAFTVGYAAALVYGFVAFYPFKL